MSVSFYIAVFYVTSYILNAPHCNLVRRELAAREHILVHEAGKGQQAFAPHRRDMGAHRAEQERLRSTAATTSAAGIAGLRISNPVQGLRIAKPLPRVALPLESLPDLSPEKVDSLLEDLPISLAETPPPPAPLVETDVAVTSPPSPPRSPPLLPTPLCSSYFVEPLSWMSPTLESGVLAGKLVCAGKRCGAKLGSYDWAGLRALLRYLHLEALGILLFLTSRCYD